MRQVLFLLWVVFGVVLESPCACSWGSGSTTLCSTVRALALGGVRDSPQVVFGWHTFASAATLERVKGVCGASFVSACFEYMV